MALSINISRLKAVEKILKLVPFHFSDTDTAFFSSFYSVSWQNTNSFRS